MATECVICLLPDALPVHCCGIAIHRTCYWRYRAIGVNGHRCPQCRRSYSVEDPFELPDDGQITSQGAGYYTFYSTMDRRYVVVVSSDDGATTEDSTTEDEGSTTEDEEEERIVELGHKSSLKCQRQRSEDRGRKSEGRRQMTDDR